MDCTLQTLVEREYHKPNYRIIQSHAKTKDALVLLSSNGLYYPDDTTTFINTIVKNDRYEWTNVIKNPVVPHRFKKIILIRDVHKHYYLQGINDKINNMESLVEFVRQETDGYKVTLAGGSAGGFAAAYIGEQLHAFRVLSFAGQIRITGEWERIHFGREILDKYDCTEHMDNIGYVYYFYAAHYEEDVVQASFIKNDQKNVYRFAMDTYMHGDTVQFDSRPYLLTMQDEALTSVAMKYQDQIISPEKLSRDIIPFYARMFYAAVKQYLHLRKK